MAEEMTAKEKEIRFAFLEKFTRLKSLMAIYDPEDYDAEMLAHQEVQWLGEIKEAVHAINNQAMQKAIENTDKDYQKIYEKIVAETNKNCQQFIIKYQRKIMTQQVFSPAHVNISNSGEAAAAAEKVKRAKIEVDIDAEIIFHDIKSLEVELNKIDDWSKAESHIIELYMQKVDQWKKQLKFLQDKVRGIKKNTVVYDLDISKLLRSESLVASLKTEIEIAVEQLEFEDEERCLYSLNKSKTSAVKYPQFSGHQDEDYVKFEKEFRNCFRVNRVRLDDQVSTLRENLRGEALSLIPVTMVNIEESFKVLSNVYGDPSRVMNSRKAKINSMGSFTKLVAVKTGVGVQAQVEWLIKLEIYLQDMFDLAETSPDMDREVYNQSTFNSIMKLFPLEVHLLMADEIGDIKDQTNALFNYVVERREVLQKTLKTLQHNFMHSHVVTISSLEIRDEADVKKLERITGANDILNVSQSDCSYSDEEEGDPGGGLDATMHSALISQMNPDAPLCDAIFCSSTSYPEPNSQKITGM